MKCEHYGQKNRKKSWKGISINSAAKTGTDL